ncbi:MAG TPA: tetraacyldisaccharide 4'-kinase [Bacteroidales bacterium]|nr:tetraacyldisaccharide 4'-kinase [Bacteroidales bacterium]
MGEKRNILLYPLSLLYGMITGIRNFLYDKEVLDSKEFDLPVICVGNITVGGTGKTPHTEYLVSLLIRNNFRVATLSRGYKRKTRDFRIATQVSGVNDIGDEPLQIFRKFPGITVAVDRKRVNGITKILENDPGTDVIILDDGFQHRKIRPGVSILLTDFERLIVNDHMLPYGNLRESAFNMHRADIILVTKSPGDLSPIQRRLIVKEMDKAPYQNLYFTTIVYKDPIPVFEEVKDVPPPLTVESGDCSIVLVTGIANPDPLKKYLDDKCRNITHMNYADHHNYTEADLKGIINAWSSLKSPVKYIITTEKDAVRFREFSNIAESLKTAFYYIPVGIDFLNDDRKEFDNLIIDYVRKNKRNNRVS